MVGVRGVGVGHHDVGLDRGPVPQPHALGAPADRAGRVLDDDLGHVGARADLGAALQGPQRHRVDQAAEPAVDVPGAEGLLDVGHGGQGGRGPAGVGAGVGGVAVQQHPQPGVLEVPPAQPAQALPGRDRHQVTDLAGLPEQAAGTLERGAEERPPGGLPDLPGPLLERRPLSAGPGPQGGVHGRGHAVTTSGGDVEHGAVGEAVAERRVHRPQVHDAAQRRPGQGEELLVHRGDREQGRAGVEAEPVAAVPAELAAHAGRLLQHRDPVPGVGEPGGRRQTAEPCPHHDDPAHATSRPFHRSVPRYRPTNEAAVRAAASTTEIGWATASGRERAPVASAVR